MLIGCTSLSTVDGLLATFAGGGIGTCGDNDLFRFRGGRSVRSIVPIPWLWCQLFTCTDPTLGANGDPEIFSGEVFRLCATG